MTNLLLLDCDGTIRQSASGKQFIQHPQDQKIIEGAARAIAHYREEDRLAVELANINFLWTNE